jgi:hypothetical protein
MREAFSERLDHGHPRGFKVGSLLRLTFLHVPVGLAEGLVQAIVSGMASLKRLAEG